jgi:hypothetical protein
MKLALVRRRGNPFSFFFIFSNIHSIISLYAAYYGKNIDYSTKNKGVISNGYDRTIKPT